MHLYELSFKSIHSCSNTAMRFFVIGNLVIGRLKQRFIFVLLGRGNGLNHCSFQGTHCCHEFFVLFYIFEGNFRVISSWLIGGGGWVGLFTISWSGKGQGYWRRTSIHIFLFWCRHIFGMTGVPYICNGASLQVWHWIIRSSSLRRHLGHELSSLDVDLWSLTSSSSSLWPAAVSPSLGKDISVSVIAHSSIRGVRGDRGTVAVVHQAVRDNFPVCIVVHQSPTQNLCHRLIIIHEMCVLHLYQATSNMDASRNIWFVLG